MKLVGATMTKLPYRENVQAWVFNEEGKILLLDVRTKSGYYKFLQGGLEEGENHLEALRRELKEEMNITHFEVIKRAKYEHYYEWDEKRQKERGYRGQHQVIFLVKLKPGNSFIPEDEIDSFEWLRFEQIMTKFDIPNQIEMAQKIWAEFQTTIESAKETP